MESVTHSCADSSGQEGGNCDANFCRAPRGDHRTTDLGTQCLLDIFVEVECKIWVRVIDEIKVKTAFAEDENKNSLKVSNLVGENNPL